MKRFNEFLDEEDTPLLNEASTLTKAFAISQYLAFRGEKTQLLTLARQIKEAASAIEKAKDVAQLKSAGAKALRLHGQTMEQLAALLTLIMHVSATSAALAGKDKTSQVKR